MPVGTRRMLACCLRFTLAPSRTADADNNGHLSTCLLVRLHLLLPHMPCPASCMCCTCSRSLFKQRQAACASYTLEVPCARSCYLLGRRLCCHRPRTPMTPSCCTMPTGTTRPSSTSPQCTPSSTVARPSAAPTTAGPGAATSASRAAAHFPSAAGQAAPAAPAETSVVLPSPWMCH